MSFGLLRSLTIMMCAVISLGGMTATAAHAQQQQVPSTADPGRIEERVTPPRQEWQRLEQAAPTPQAIPMPPEGAEELRFILQSLSIEGMTAYSDAEIRPLYARYIGQEISVATLFQIMGQLQQKYLEDGYTLTKVFIPNQNIEGGNAKLLVVEGYVSEVEIDQKVLHSPVIEDARLRILKMHPLNTIELERLLLVLNDMPGLNVSAVLASIKATEPTNVPQGAVRLLLQKNDKNYSYGKIAFDNYGSVFSGPYQVRGLAHAPHVFMPYSELSMMVLGATQLPEQRYGALSYKMPIFGASGTVLSFSGTMARTEPGSNLDPLDVQGRSESLAGDISYPLIKQRAKELILDAGFEFKNSKTDLLGERLYDDHQRILNTGVNYNFSDSLFGLNIFDLHFSKGLNILGVREKGSVDLSRADGHPDFSKFNMAAGRLQALPENFEAYVMLTGQYTNTPLLSSEEFGFGGDQIGRGYNPSEIAGDRGMSASLEIRYKSMVEYGGWDVAIQPYGFFDIGKVWNIDNDDTTHMSGASTGVGMRINIENQWDSDISLAFPLTRPAENPPKYSDRYGPRLMFSLSRKF